MEHALSSRGYAVLIAHWAWNDVVEEFDLQHGGARSARSRIEHNAAFDLLDRQVKATTTLWVSSVTLTSKSVDNYVQELLTALGQVSGPSLTNELRSSILDVYAVRLEDLAKGDLLKSICRSVLDAAIAVYRSYGVDVPLDYGTRVAIELIWQKKPPVKSFPSPFSGGASVTLGCAPSCCGEDVHRHMQQLSVVLAPPYFDEPTQHSLIFALFHECVSHVLQGPYSRKRRIPPTSSSFAEGWMDKVALMVLRLAVDRAPAVDGVELPHASRHGAYYTWGEILFEARHNRKNTDEYDRDAAGRRQGKKAAELLLSFYRDFPVPNPHDALLRISTALNASYLSPARRDRFVELIIGALSPLSPWPGSVTAPAKSALYKFVTDIDLDRLLARLESLFRTAKH